MPTTKSSRSKNKAEFNSVQLNLVTFVDVSKAMAANSLEGNIYMMDNSPESENKGTPDLKTVCKQGQTLNWIIYAMDANKRLDGTWPPMVKIANIVFLRDDGERVSEHRICTEFKIFGAPDKMRSKDTPVYYYWAGTVIRDLPPGEYKYRLVLELNSDTAHAQYMNLNSPALSVIPV